MSETDVTITNLRIGTDALREDTRRAKQDIAKLADDVSRQKIEIAASAKFEKLEFTRKVNEAVREMQGVADRNPVRIKVETESGIFSRGGQARSEIAGFGSFLRGGGVAAVGTIAMNALAESMERFTKRVEAGDATWVEFAEDFQRSIPILNSGFKILDAGTDLAQATRLRDAGLPIGPVDVSEDERGGRVISGQRKRAAAGVESITEKVDKDSALAELRGADVLREKARQITQERLDAVAKIMEDVRKQTDNKPVSDQIEKLTLASVKIEEDLVKELARIDENEADALGKEADKRAEGAAKFAEDAGEAMMKAEEAREKELEHARKEVEQAREAFTNEMEREVEGTRRMGAEGREAALRGRGLGGAADAVAKEERIRRLFDEAGDDPDRLRAARSISLAMLDEKKRSGGGFSMRGGGDYGRMIQDAILSAPENPQKEWAIDGMSELRNKLNRGENPFGAGGGGTKLDSAAAKLDKAADKLSKLQTVGVVRS